MQLGLGHLVSHSHVGASTLILILFPCCQFDRGLLLSVLCCATEPARKMICSAKPMPVKVQLFTLVAAPHGPGDPVKFPCLAESWRPWPSDAPCSGPASRYRKRRPSPRAVKKAHTRAPTQVFRFEPAVKSH